jgi:hypothetical protein
MKKVVLTFGVLCGLLPILTMIIGLMVGGSNWQGSLVLGWTVIILSSLFIFFGIRSYRENYNNGLISFGKAFKVGILIALIGGLMYVLVWEIMYFNFMHDMMDPYFAAELDKLKASGASPEKIEESKAFWEMYKTNPFVNGAMTILEPLTITLPVTLISALILKRNTKKDLVNA